jgi:hypothetical protein
MGAGEGALEGRQPFREETNAREDVIAAFVESIEEKNQVIALIGTTEVIYAVYGTGTVVAMRLREVFEKFPDIQIIGSAKLSSDFEDEAQRQKDKIVQKKSAKVARVLKESTDTGQVSGMGRFIRPVNAHFGSIDIMA